MNDLIRLSDEQKKELQDFIGKVTTDMRQHGFSIVFGKTVDGVRFAYTVGLYFSYKHPELVVLGMTNKDAQRMLNDFHREIREGRSFLLDEQVDGMVPEGDVVMAPVPAPHYHEYCKANVWIYKHTDFPVMQVVCPDDQGLFPWDFNYRTGCFLSQPVLGIVGFGAVSSVSSGCMA